MAEPLSVQPESPQVEAETEAAVADSPQPMGLSLTEGPPPSPLLAEDQISHSRSPQFSAAPPALATMESPAIGSEKTLGHVLQKPAVPAARFPIAEPPALPRSPAKPQPVTINPLPQADPPSGSPASMMAGAMGTTGTGASPGAPISAAPAQSQSLQTLRQTNSAISQQATALVAPPEIGPAPQPLLSGNTEALSATSEFVNAPIEPAPNPLPTVLATQRNTDDIPLNSVAFTAIAPKLAPAQDFAAPLQNQGLLLAQGEAETELIFPEVDPELGIIRVRNRLEDPELGVIRIRQQPLETPILGQPKPAVLFLTGRLSFVSSDNIFFAVDPVLGGLVGDEFLRPGISLVAFPALGPKTNLLASAEVNFLRYTDQSSADYDELRLRLGVRQQLRPRAYGQISFSYQSLFRPGFQDRFFKNESLELLVARQDPITSRLALDSYYQMQINFSQPTDFNRIVQFAGVYLGYTISPQFRTGISYQLTLADYTRDLRFDAYHQIIGQFIYYITPSTRMSLFGGFSFGSSSDPNIRFNDTVFGINLESTLSLF